MSGAVWLPKRLYRFESASSTYTSTFPLIGYEYESTQDLKIPTSPIIGVNYGFDMLGDNEAIKDFGEERVRFSIHSKCDPSEIDDEFTALKRNMLKAKRGKGWLIDSNGIREWAEMRLQSMPTYTIQNVDEPAAAKLLDVVAIFTRYTDFFKATAITDTETVTASGQTWTVNNPGGDTATRMTIRLRANASANFNTSVLENLTTGREFRFTTVMNSSSEEIKLDTRTPSVEYSSNDGGSYSDAWGDYTLPPSTQRILSFDLAAGNNSLRFTASGTVRVNVEIEADAPV